MSTLLLKLILFAHGALGGIMLLMVERGKSYVQSAKLLVVSGIAGGTLTPAITEHWHLGPAVSNGTAVVLGLASWKLAQGLLKLLNKFVKDPISILKLWRR